MLNKALAMEITHEAVQTRKMLERVPLGQSDWKPHNKSMHLGKIANHLAGIIGYIPIILGTSSLDITKAKLPLGNATNMEALLADFDRHVEEAIEALNKTDESTLREPWSLTNGERNIFTLPKVAALRSMSISHLIHHRGQLSVFLRLLDVPVPGMYGPSADEPF